MEASFYIKNREKFFDRIADNSVSLLYSGRLAQKSNDQEYAFEVEKNFYYLAGINEDKVILALIKKGGECREILFIEKNDPILSKWVGRKLEKQEVRAISGINEIYYLEEFDDFIYSLLNSTRTAASKVHKLFLNLERRNLPGYSNWALEFCPGFSKQYPEIDICNLRDTVIGLRMIKQEEELSLIKKAIAVTKRGIEDMLTGLRPAMYEYHLDAIFDFAVKYNGNYNLAFDTIVASGKNATILHYVSKNAQIHNGDLVLFDLGARTNFYVSDISRTVPAGGRFTPRQRAVYEEVLRVNKMGIAYLRPGVTWSGFNNYCNELLLAGLKRLGLIEKDEDLRKYYYHSIGHFIGLDTHDPSLAETPFAPGMVLTVEPGLYIEEENIGVRIEDNVLITENGHENLSKDIIKEPDDIERFMTAYKRGFNLGVYEGK